MRKLYFNFGNVFTLPDVLSTLLVLYKGITFVSDYSIKLYEDSRTLDCPHEVLRNRRLRRQTKCICVVRESGSELIEIIRL